MPAESSSVNSYKSKAALSPVQLVLLGAGQKNYYNNTKHNSHPIWGYLTKHCQCSVTGTLCVPWIDTSTAVNEKNVTSKLNTCIK